MAMPIASNHAQRRLASLVAEIGRCRICRDAPDGKTLPHEPRPVLRPSTTARICIASQAPGMRVHASGMPFTDPSGDRLRAWLQLTPEEFYDQRRIAIVAIGFCFPGHDAAGGDLPPRRECAPAWQNRLFAAMPQLQLILAVGSYAQHWHLGTAGGGNMTATVARWRELLEAEARPRRVALPHPSWRNNAWLTANPWFEREMLPRLRREVRELL
jgi:uracil-DNA glycosylase